MTGRGVVKMKMNEVRKKAKSLGIKAKNPTKAELIKMIQRAEGNFDCFGTAKDFCDQRMCCFRDDCLTISNS
jgi:hypothetical protein